MPGRLVRWLGRSPHRSSIDSWLTLLRHPNRPGPASPVQGEQEAPLPVRSPFRRGAVKRERRASFGVRAGCRYDGTWRSSRSARMLSLTNLQRHEGISADVNDLAEWIIDGPDSRRLESFARASARWPPGEAGSVCCGPTRIRSRRSRPSRPSNRRRTCPWRPGPPIDSARPPIPRGGRSGMTACGARSDQDLDATADLFGRLATDDPDRFGRLVQPGPLSGLDGKEPRGDRLPGPRGRPRGGAGVRPGRRRLDSWPKYSARGEEPRRWPTTCGSLARWPGNRAIRRGCSTSFPKSSASPRPAHQGESAEEIPEIEVFEWLDRPVASLADRRPSGRAAADGSGERLYQRSNASALEPPRREPRTDRGGPLSAARERRRLGPA